MFTLGVSYYPELVDPGEWNRDLENMNDAGLTLIRILDFAWTAIEPREGVYQFEWLDEFLNLAESMNFQIILCTPTATPPAWLASQYPQIMIELRNGDRCPWGGRRDACVNSPIFRHFSKELARILGERYGNRKCVVGWQIDNELIGSEIAPPECHCPECQWLYRDWLKRHYAGVEELNRAWGMRFWSQEYSDWGETETPRSHRAVLGNVLDYGRFFNDSQVSYIKLQYDALRQVIDDSQYVSHNSTGVFDRALNHIDYARALDVTGWDAYRNAAGKPHSEAFAALAHDLFRSALNKPFIIFETNTESRGGDVLSPAFWAEMRAHGAEAMVFWHWRRHRFNSERTAPAFCDHAGIPDSKRLELVRNFKERIAFDDSLPERLPLRSAAILYSADCVRAQHRDAQPWLREQSRPLPYLVGLIKLYQPFWQLGAPLDVREPGDDLSTYKLVVMPGVQLMSEIQAQEIRRFVEKGGVLVASAKTAHSDLHGVYYPQLGRLILDVLGFSIPTFRLEGVSTVRMADGREFPVEGEAEPIEAKSAEVLGCFLMEDGASSPAVVAHSFGKGKVYYMACVSRPLGVELARMALKDAGLPFVDNDDDRVSSLPHFNGSGTWHFNHGDEPMQVQEAAIAPRDFYFEKAD